mgnify:CR=1 FL=1
MHQALWQLLAAVCARQPVAVIAEDVHWMDPESAAVLTGLARQLPGMRLLLVEDSEMDGLLMTTWLKRGGFELTTKRVYTAEDFERVLMSEEWDVVISDYNMPKFDALSALRIFQGKSLDIPFIIVSGGIGEETAVAAMRAGAHDYVMKDNMHRLAPAVERELREAADRELTVTADGTIRVREGLRATSDAARAEGPGKSAVVRQTLRGLDAPIAHRRIQRVLR